MLAQGRRDIESYVRGLFQAWQAKGQSASQHSAAEAVNLARMTHTYILEMRCPRVALRSSILMEMVLRRLYALIMVEQLVVESMERAVARAREFAG